MICVYLAGMPLAMRELLRALGRDERLSLFVIPLSVNVMFCFGLLPFVFGFPIMLFALAAAVRHFRKPSRKSGIVLALLVFALGYVFGLISVLQACDVDGAFRWGGLAIDCHRVLEWR